MNILKKLATPFIVVGRWIKETAWVQPLLIVGVIFAIIFSIPSITSGIQGLIDSQSDDMNWYKNFQISLDGTYDKTSDANDFFADFVSAQEGTDENPGWIDSTQEGKQNARNIVNNYSNGAGKFFLFFVQEDCSACSELKDAAERLIDNWSTYIVEAENQPTFQYQSIICDEDIDASVYDNTPAFEYLLGDSNYNRFAEAAIQVGQDNNYYRNADSTVQTTIRNNLEALVSSDSSSSTLSSNFETPLCVLIDTTESNVTNNIISTIFYSLEGDDIYERTQFLADAWTGSEKFSSNYRG